MAHQPAKLPPYRPQLALLVKTPPEGDDWLHELKLDGFRIGVEIDRGKVRLLSRREKEWTERISVGRRGREAAARQDRADRR